MRLAWLLRCSRCVTWSLFDLVWDEKKEVGSRGAMVDIYDWEMRAMMIL